MRSRLAVYCGDNGSIETVLATDRHIEAPNWSGDGSSLIVNGSGRLYRVPLAAPMLHEIDTGFAVKINNDHGVSPDGKSLVISNSSESGGSCIYTLPLSGGEPKRVTEKKPSYWHGWSPDGDTLAYVGKRSATFQVVHLPDGGRRGDATDGRFRSLRWARLHCRRTLDLVQRRAGWTTSTYGACIRMEATSSA